MFKSLNKILISLNTFTIIATLALVSFTSEAKLMTGYSSSVGMSTHVCPSYCTNPEFSFDGGDMVTSAEAELNTPNAQARAFSSLSGSSYLPILKAESIAGAGFSASAEAYSLQQFNYTGSTSTTISLNLNLHGTSLKNDTNNSTFIKSEIGIVIGTEIDYYRSFESMMEVGNPFDAYTSMRIVNEEDANKPSTLNFSLNPGDSFFVVSAMKASARNGFSDAWNTLTMNFTDPTHLVAASAPVGPTPSIPEPNVILLFLFSLFCLSAARLKQ